MILKTKYEKESDIPEALKPYYVQVGDEWVFDGADEIAAALNPQLAKNRDDLLKENGELKTAKETAEAAVAAANAEGKEEATKAMKDALAGKDERIKGLQDQIGAQKDQLAVVVEYQKFGSPAEVKNKIGQLKKYEETGLTPKQIADTATAKGDLEKKVQNQERDSAIREAADLSSLDYGVLRDLVTHQERGAGIVRIESKDVTENEKPVRKSFVVTKGADEKEVETALDKYATERTDWQPYMSALKKTPEKKPARFFGTPPSGNKPPEKEDFLDQTIENLNKARNSRTSPFPGAQPKDPAQAGA